MSGSMGVGKTSPAGPRINMNPLGAWAVRAACVNANPDLFVPSREHRAPSLRRAAEYCGSCPVRAECLADAEANGLTGVWGGVLFKSASKRRALLRGVA